jgi:hypothetical protein
MVGDLACHHVRAGCRVPTIADVTIVAEFVTRVKSNNRQD